MATVKAKPKKKSIVLDVLPPGAVVLSLDVSSSACGWAIGRKTEGGVEVLDFGVVRPPSGWDFARKIKAMTDAINGLCKDWRYGRVVMEFQSHKNTGKHVQGLAVLGQAQGAVWQNFQPHMAVERISERTWTKINGKNARKDVRCEHVKAVVPAYAERLAANPKFDPGKDAADAVGLLLWRASQ
jgi:Holliday junction resolvasome RuvABC endonuclease subunit